MLMPAAGVVAAGVVAASAAAAAEVALAAVAAGAGASAAAGRMARSGSRAVPAAAEHQADPVIMAVRQAKRAADPVITALPVEVRSRQLPVMPAQRAPAGKITAHC